MKLALNGYLYESVDVDSIQQELSKKYNVDLSLMGYGKDAFVIVKMVIPKEIQGQKIGSRLMKDITSYADNNSLTILLNLADRGTGWGTTSKSRLVSFYKQFGFVENKGKNKDFSISYGMYRLPNKIKNVESPVITSFDRIYNGKFGDDSFKEWFNGSVVVNKKGDPMIVYHGTPDARFAANGEEFNSNNGVFFFSDNKSVAGSYKEKRALDYQNSVPGIIKAYLKITNPLVIDAKGSNWKNTSNYINKAKSEGYDGIIILNSLDYHSLNNLPNSKTSTVFAVFSASQIKILK
jgi:hypothetical protein